MKLGKKIALLAILGVTSLVAVEVTNINVLVDKINNTTDQEVKSQLLKQLDDELDAMDKKDLPKAQEIINAKLNQSKVLKK